MRRVKNYRRVNISLHKGTLKELDRQAKRADKTRSRYIADFVEGRVLYASVTRPA